jgi:hypothetical protein
MFVMNKQTQEAFGSDAQLEKHAKEYHGLTLNQFKLMCEEAHKRYEGQFSNSVDKALAVESFYEGFKVAIKEALEQPAQDNCVHIGMDKCPHKGICQYCKQPAQEPVAHIYQNNAGYPSLMWNPLCVYEYKSIILKQPKIPLYTHPHQWQGLTDDEIRSFVCGNAGATALFYMLKDDVIGSDYRKCIESFARAIEQALKEKNT